jgi:ATPase subunit of ABC transporter with duplicated ATPase domains
VSNQLWPRFSAPANTAPTHRPPARPQAFIDKFRFNAKRASLVQSRIKALERMAEVQVRPHGSAAETAAAASRMSEAVASVAGGQVVDC